jgi:ADP-ribose pyrophosphatase YjhB (NUDIX family)
MIPEEGIFLHWEQYVMKVLSVCKIGLKYSKDPYAIENYKQLQNLSNEMLERQQNYPKKDNFYERDIYPTPNLSVRVLVFNEHQELLMVKERSDGKWAVPGGWVDVFDTPAQAAVSEVQQEAGLHVKIVRLLAIMQREKYKDYPTLVSETVHYFLGEYVNGELTPSHETLEVAYFNINQLPELSKKTTAQEIKTAFDVLFNNRPTYFE